MGKNTMTKSVTALMAPGMVAVNGLSKQYPGTLGFHTFWIDLHLKADRRTSAVLHKNVNTPMHQHRITKLLADPKSRK